MRWYSVRIPGSNRLLLVLKSLHFTKLKTHFWRTISQFWRKSPSSVRFLKTWNRFVYTNLWCWNYYAPCIVAKLAVQAQHAGQDEEEGVEPAEQDQDPTAPAGEQAVAQLWLRQGETSKGGQQCQIIPLLPCDISSHRTQSEFRTIDSISILMHNIHWILSYRTQLSREKNIYGIQFPFWYQRSELGTCGMFKAKNRRCPALPVILHSPTKCD